MTLSDLLEKTKGHTSGWHRDGRNIVASGRGIVATIPTPQQGGVFDCEQNINLLEGAPYLLTLAQEQAAEIERLKGELGSWRRVAEKLERERQEKA